MTQPNAEQPATHDPHQPTWSSPAEAPAPPQFQSYQAPAGQYQQHAAAPQPQYYQAAPPQNQPMAQQQFQGQYQQMPQQQLMPAMPYGYPEPKSKLAAGLLGIFLGGLGIHRFYLGHTTIGVIQLVLTVLLGIFTFGLVALWGFVEGIMILAGAAYFQRDARGIPLRE